MKRKDTSLIIICEVNPLAFELNNFKENMERLAYEVTYYGEGKFDRWNIQPVNVIINDTSLEERKIVRFIYTINSVRHNSNYENSVGMKICLNIQKVFNSANILIGEKRPQCFVDRLYNSRLAK